MPGVIPVQDLAASMLQQKGGLQRMAAEEGGARHDFAAFWLEFHNPQGILSGLNQGPLAGSFQNSANYFTPASFHPCF